MLGAICSGEHNRSQFSRYKAREKTIRINMEPEPECDEQREARDLLEKMEKEVADLREMQQRGEAPRPEDFPAQAAIEERIESQIKWLKKEVARPASQRLPKDAAPPREVLS